MWGRKRGLTAFIVEDSLFSQQSGENRRTKWIKISIGSANLYKLQVPVLERSRRLFFVASSWKEEPVWLGTCGCNECANCVKWCNEFAKVKWQWFLDIESSEIKQSWLVDLNSKSVLESSLNHSHCDNYIVVGGFSIAACL